MSQLFHPKIVCAYLYNITKYGYPPPAPETPRFLEEMSHLGFRSVELEGIRENHLKEMHKMRHQIARKRDDLKLNIPVYCTVLPALSSVSSSTRHHQLELFKYGCETAVTLGASYVLDNGPLPPFQFSGEIPVARHYEHKLLSEATLPDHFSWSSYWEDLISTFRDVCEIAADHNLTYLMHPATGVLASTPEAFLYFHQAVDRSNLGFNFDTSNLLGFKSNLILALHQLMDHVPYIHVSDNSGTRNEHLALGEGIINWTGFFNELKKMGYDGYIGIDIGGAESHVSNLDEAYSRAADQIERDMNFD